MDGNKTDQAIDILARDVMHQYIDKHAENHIAQLVPWTAHLVDRVREIAGPRPNRGDVIAAAATYMFGPPPTADIDGHGEEAPR